MPGSFFTIEPPGKPFGDSLLVVVFIGLYWWYVSLESSKRTGIRVITLAGTELTAISPPITSGTGWQVYLHATLAEEAHHVVETHDVVEIQSYVFWCSITKLSSNRVLHPVLELYVEASAVEHTVSLHQPLSHSMTLECQGSVS